MVKTAAVNIFDRTTMRQRQRQNPPLDDSSNFLEQHAAKRLLESLDDIKRHFPLASYFGAHNPPPHTKIQRLLHFDTLCADEEFLPIKNGSLDLLISGRNLHTINDLPGSLTQIRRALKADGLFLGAMLGGESLYELRESLTQAELKTKGGASPRVFPFADKLQMAGLMQRAGFALPVIDSEIITVTYPDMFKLMHDLRAMGCGNIIANKQKRNPGKAFFAEAAQHYRNHFSEPDGRLRARFEVIYLLGWAPHESQQQPLRPGSAKTRLADALDASEIKTGEKATP